jgi:hypothetical protein
MGEERRVYRVLVRRPEEMRPLGKSRRRCENGMRMGSEWILGRLAGSVEWIQLAENSGRWKALVNTMKNLRFLAPLI